jgi:hypothetical protein
MVATKASFYGGNGGNKGSFQRWQWRQQRLLSTAVMAATNTPFYGINSQLRKASFYGGDGGNKGSFPQRQWLLSTTANGLK